MEESKPRSRGAWCLVRHCDGDGDDDDDDDGFGHGHGHGHGS